MSPDEGPAPASSESGKPLPAAEPASEPVSGEGAREAPGADDTLPILCVRNLVLFPGVVLPITIGRKRSIQAVQGAVRGEKPRPLGLLLQKNPEVENPGKEELYQVGCVAEVLRYLTAPDGSHHVICQGLQRFRVLEFVETDPFYVARVESHEEAEESSKDIEARFLSLKQQAAEALQLLPNVPDELEGVFQTVDSPSTLADRVVTFMDVAVEEKQDILEAYDIRKRLDKVSKLLSHRLEVLRLSRDISQQTQGTLEKAQRDYYLREQLKTIQKELGEEDAKGSEIQELSEAITKAGMPEEVEKEARKELTRLQRMPEAAAEYSMVRTYVDWLIELPWSRTTEDSIDIGRAREILDEDHYGLEKVKKRIVEFLAVRKLKPEGKSAILCLVGPPGVGKTSIGQSIARAMGRKFVRISLGGVHDEAEIRGHRRTYIGALPGTIIQSIRKSGSKNPVFMLDEVDKLSASFHGDPASALLEVLDPEQNATFRDNYLGVPFDLSRVMFISTANVIDAIPGPLRDRCEVIEMPGYTEEEKIQIARRYLVKRRLEESGLTDAYCEITDDALRDIVRYYTREAGCRNLERTIGSVCRSVATRLAEVPVPARGGSGDGSDAAALTEAGKPPITAGAEEDNAAESPSEPSEAAEAPAPSPAPVTRLPSPADLKKAQPDLELPVRVGAEDLHSILGSRKFENEVAMRTSIPGVATGLAWTPTGGSILFVEATRMPGKGQLILTGQLGDIMKESAQAAISLVKSRAESLGVDSGSFEKTDVHVHVPAGAIPKDGPSAGVAIYTALVSLVTGQQVRSDVAMTGEISLRGLVLPVGGIKEKVLAAHRAGISSVFLPARNKKDFEDIPSSAREKLSFVWLENVDEAISVAISRDTPLPGVPVPHQ